MPLSILVRTYTGEVLATSLHPAIGAICESARKRGLVMLGCVDKYDDTVFNRTQVSHIRGELVRLRELCDADETVALSELVKLLDVVSERPHRYLVFNGD
ncbi:hypothetical protein ACFWD7_57970 [Streptomyces mirabilis]|uniref:hypothetical protein n=1 Tax=Streptomyces mirabilis TaxID=68239 RepID=UPI0021C0AD80|nr:hypothetical protein [Streptomyces mirabilis]MCT9112668.1 hypothetical protein [Streptomyces mirabilis]